MPPELMPLNAIPPNAILVIDNYDSFVFNLSRYVEELGTTTVVRRNDAITLNEIEQAAPAAIILSPGPGTPQQAGICEKVILHFGPTIPILGVCLGHQAIASALGGNVVKADAPVHGRTSLITHTQQGLFANCKNPLLVSRYHSLIAEKESLPAELTITALTETGMIMAFQHSAWPMYGVQFHPESILTQSGHMMLGNFLRRAGFEQTTTLHAGDVLISPDTSPDFYSQAISEDAFRPL